MLIHGVALTAGLNWGLVFAPLARHFGVAAVDQRNHGDGISAGSRFRLEDCADDIAELGEIFGIGRFVAVGYSMGGMIAQLLYRRHPSLLSGLVPCTTARNVRGSPAEQLAALALPAVAAAVRWNLVVQILGAGMIGAAVLGQIDDPATGEWVRDQLRRTTLAAAVSAIEAVCAFTSHDWIGQVDIPVAVIVTARLRASKAAIAFADRLSGGLVSGSSSSPVDLLAAASISVQEARPQAPGRARGVPRAGLVKNEHTQCAEVITGGRAPV